MLNRCCFFILMGGVFMAGCSNEQKAPTNYQAEVKKPELMGPFKYHKLIEASPGKYYDVFSWGRGAGDTSAFLILHSDSSGKKYTTTTGDLNGTIVDVFNTDMDVDGNAEILIQAKRKDTVNYTSIYAFEFSNSKAEKLEFPKLTATQRKGYRGNDNFYVEDGKFMREFPIYEGSGKDAKPTAQKRKLEYGLRENSFTVKQISKDSTSKTDIKATGTITTKKEESPKKEKAAKKSKKHHEEVKHKKTRKKHHHNRDEEQ